MIANSLAIQPGCDWQVRTNGTWDQGHTSWGVHCSNMTWTDVDGNPIPTSDITCCDFDENGYITGGINCPFAIGAQRVPFDQVSDDGWHEPGASLIGNNKPTIINKYHREKTFGNWQLSNDLRLAINMNDELAIYDNNLKISKAIIKVNNIFDGKPVDITVNKVGYQIEIIANPLLGKSNKLDVSGAKKYYYNLKEMEAQLYGDNIDKFVQLYPNPVLQNSDISFEKKIDKEINVMIFSSEGKLVKNIQINSKNSTISTSDMNTGLYRCILSIDGQKVNSKIIIIR